MKGSLTSVFMIVVAGIVSTARATTNALAQVDRNDPNFVTASLLVASPGRELFACAGHACLRMECPTFNLDSCYSYESESASSKVLAFLAGRLKMGMFAVKTADYLEQYRQDGRGVRQYRLNLSPAVKVRLWKILDDKVALGPDQPYDYEKRGCAQVMFRALQEASAPHSLEVKRWPPVFERNMRKVFCSAITDYPWMTFYLNAMVGTGLDLNKSNYDKLCIPRHLVEVLQASTLEGKVLVDEGPGEELLPDVNKDEALAGVTPMFVACLLLALAVVNCFLRLRAVDWLFLLIQTLIGVFVAYLVLFSSLPCTNWNWQLIPFNPLPLVFWRWRRWWIPAFVAVTLVWCAYMMFSHEMLTDPAYVVLALATAVNYCAMWYVIVCDIRRNVMKKFGKITANGSSANC